ncbi:uncharacterized protein LTR77_010250 [Saxophila tyrrhenica]|uniref:Xylanolytic transcriptional activator regulatory domain-containing protein n=1 Tax=Saxophila tyrrhenica TaxID=1690608 RepID=A0AAV9NY04_9PEZI|nr:hypothetical protein LTR77_010250 [Saxophila tyrrhenica]
MDGHATLRESSRPEGPRTVSARPYRSKKRRPVGVAELAVSSVQTTRIVHYVITEEQNTPKAAQTNTTPLSQPVDDQERGIEPPTGGASRDSAPTTVQRDRTFLYTGASSDQDVYLLRHLPYDDRDLYGHEDWTVWRALASDTHPAYFTSYPNRLLDARDDIYELDEVRSIVSPHEDELLRLYYTHFHPSLPILESRETFTRQVAARNVPASLLAAVYAAALDFWDGEDAVLTGMGRLRCSVFESTLREARTPSLRTVQALLIYLQLAPEHVREPNHPGFWPLTAQLVGIAQEIGLHADPQHWKVQPAERKLRRILWWSVYMQDKWCVAHHLDMK